MKMKGNNNCRINLSSIHRLGPLTASWCMCMEAKNSYFKQIARMGNFKNIAYSVAKRHQRLLCSSLQGKFFSYDDLECGPCRFFRQYTHIHTQFRYHFVTAIPGIL